MPTADALCTAHCHVLLHRYSVQTSKKAKPITAPPSTTPHNNLPVILKPINLPPPCLNTKPSLTHLSEAHPILFTWKPVWDSNPEWQEWCYNINKWRGEAAAMHILGQVSKRIITLCPSVSWGQLNVVFQDHGLIHCPLLCQRLVERRKCTWQMHVCTVQAYQVLAWL